MKWIPTAAAAALLTSSTALAGDAATGERLAEQWCSSCHVIDGGTGVSGVDAAPPFRTIANTPGKTSGALRRFLLRPHSPMPDLQLSEPDIDHLIAYIETLREK